MASRPCRASGTMIRSPDRPSHASSFGDQADPAPQDEHGRLAGVLVLGQRPAGGERDEGLPQHPFVSAEDGGGATARGVGCGPVRVLSCQGVQRHLSACRQSDSAARRRPSSGVRRPSRPWAQAVEEQGDVVLADLAGVHRAVRTPPGAELVDRAEEEVDRQVGRDVRTEGPGPLALLHERAEPLVVAAPLGAYGPALVLRQQVHRAEEDGQLVQVLAAGAR